MHVSSLSPAQLSSEQLAAWQALRAQGAGLDDPFFAPGFIRTLQQVRGGLEIVAWHDGGESRGFLPLERHRDRGLPAGALISEIHGPVTAEQSAWDPAAVLSAVGLRSWDFGCVPVAQQALARFALCRRRFPTVELSAGFTAYVEGRKAAGSSAIDQLRRKRRKLAREQGPVRFEWNTDDPLALERLLDWKTDQYRRTGVRNVLDARWVVQLLRRLRADQGSRRTDSAANPGEVRGVLGALYAGQRLVAVHFGLLEPGTGTAPPRVLSWWLPAYDADFGRYSPGAILLLDTIEAAAERGVRRIHLGQGNERYKRSFTSGGFDVAEGIVDSRGARRAWRAAWIRARDWADSSRHCAGLLRALRTLRNRRLLSAENVR